MSFLYNVRYKLLFNGTIIKKCILYNGKIEKVKSVIIIIIIIIIIITYIYHALIDTLSAHIMHINVNNAFDTLTFVIPRVNTKTFGERSFSYVGPSVWNNLPQTLHILILL